MEISERILLILQESNLPPGDFAERIGIPRSTLSHIQSGRNKPSLDLVLKIKESFPEYRWDWLLSGSGEKVELKNKGADKVISEASNSPILKSSSKDQNKTINDPNDAETLRQPLNVTSSNSPKTDDLPSPVMNIQTLNFPVENDQNDDFKDKNDKKLQETGTSGVPIISQSTGFKELNEINSQEFKANTSQSSTPLISSTNTQGKIPKRVLLLFSDGTAEAYDI